MIAAFLFVTSSSHLTRFFAFSAISTISSFVIALSSSFSSKRLQNCNTFLILVFQVSRSIFYAVCFSISVIIDATYFFANHFTIVFILLFSFR